MVYFFFLPCYFNLIYRIPQDWPSLIGIIFWSLGFFEYPETSEMWINSLKTFYKYFKIHFFLLNLFYIIHMSMISFYCIPLIVVSWCLLSCMVRIWTDGCCFHVLAPDWYLYFCNWRSLLVLCGSLCQFPKHRWWPGHYSKGVFTEVLYLKLFNFPVVLKIDVTSPFFIMFVMKHTWQCLPRPNRKLICD